MKEEVNHKHPANIQKWSWEQRIADKLATFAGSWKFILFLIFLIILWIGVNIYELLFSKFDPYPFIFLNLMLGIITAIMAPVILMSQNRQSQRDRIRSEYDYAVNKKSEKEIEEIKKQLDKIEKKLK
jgi:uncharacterized membrane protein